MKNKLALAVAALMLLSFMSLPVSAYKAGDKMATYAYTDIVTYIDNTPIESYNINWETAVVVEDLKNYGFDVIWDPTPGSRNLRVTRSGRPISSSYIPTVSRHKNGDYAGDVLYTDIVTYFDGVKVESFNINGRTIVYVNDLARFYAQPGTYKYNDSTRALSLTLKPQAAPSPSPSPTPAPQTRPLKITSQPKSVTAAVNSTVKFSVSVSGGKSPYTYTWERRSSIESAWTAVSVGTNNGVYSFKATQDILKGNYTYRCTVTDSEGRVAVSDTAALTSSVTPLKAVLSADKTTVPYGGSAKITASVTGGVAPYTYTWYKYNSLNSTWVRETSAPSNSFSVSNLTATTYVRCEVKDSADAIVTSDHITISVASSALKVTLSADKTTVSYGGSAKITASVTGGAAPYTYSWYKYNSANSTWVNQGSGSGGTCTASNVTQTTYIRCEVRDSAGSVVTSEHITISVGISGFTGTLKAEKSSVEYGGSTKLIATASGGVSPYMYNWYSYNPSTGKWVGQGMTSAGTFYLNNLTSGVTMRCEISDAKGNKTTTNEVTVGVADSFRASASADKKSVPYGGSATVTVSVTGGVSPYIYLWYAYINGQWVNLGTTPRNTYQLTNLTSNATVRCEVGDSRGNKVTTNDVTVTVTASRFSATLSSNAQSVQYGGSATMTVSVSGGTAPYLYRWYTQRGSYGWADEGYSTSNIFTLYMITEDTQVRCEVIDFLGGSAVSNTVKITCASSAPTPTPTPTPGHEGNVMILADKYQISAGGAVNFTVSADFTPAYYTWFMQYDGEGIFYNVGTTTYNTYSARLTSDVRVYCIVTGANGATAQSNYIDVIVK